MSDPDLESRLQSHYRRFRPDDSTRLLLAAETRLDEIRRQPGGTRWRRRGLAFGLVAAAAVVAVVAGGIFLGSSRATPAATSAASTTSATVTASPSARVISKADAVAALKAFLGRDPGQVTVNDPTAAAGGQAYQIMGTPDGVFGEARVDVSTGRVISLILTVPATTTVKLTPVQAQAAATAFFKAHDISIDGLTPTVKLEDHGCCKNYAVEWVRIENGVTFPESVQADVDPSNGTVYSFIEYRAPYGPVASPTIDRQKAIELATTASGLTKPKIEAVQLEVISAPAYAGTGWNGRLVWSVQLSDDSQGYVAAAWVYVDAVTGETMIAGRG
jgi:hypothetical protein